MTLILHKTLIAPQDYNRFLKAVYAEDAALLLTLDANAAKALDICVDATSQLIDQTGKLFRVEMPDGTWLGFIITKSNIIQGYYIRTTFRTKTYTDALADLITSIISNNFFNSTGADNYQNITEQLNNNSPIPNLSFDFNGKNLVLLKA